MANLSWENNGTTARIRWYDACGKRKSVRIPGVTRTRAAECQSMIEALVAAQGYPGSLPRHVAQWVADMPAELADELSAKGLLPKRQAATLKAFLDALIEAQSAKPGTKVNWGHTRRNLVAFFGADKPLRDISEADAEDFVAYLHKQGLSADTVSTRAKHARKFFKRAMKARLIPSNVFDDTERPATKPRDLTFVSRGMVATIMDQCEQEGDRELRGIVALSRFGGVRVSSEVFGMRLIDLDFDLEHDGRDARLIIRSPKTEHIPGKDQRTVPMFPELKPVLQELWDAAPEGAEFLFPEYRSKTSAYLRRRVSQVIRRAGLKVWPALFQSMRSSRETELVHAFGIELACEWIGNTPAIARRHYFQVRPEDMARAAATPTGSIPQVPGRNPGLQADAGERREAQPGHEAPVRTAKSEPQEPICASLGLRKSLSDMTIDPNGVRTASLDIESNEPASNDLQQTHADSDATSGPKSGPIGSENAHVDPELAYLLSAWPNLPADLKAKVIDMVKAVAP